MRLRDGSVRRGNRDNRGGVKPVFADENCVVRFRGKICGSKASKTRCGDIFHIGGRIGAAASGRHKDIAKIRKNEIFPFGAAKIGINFYITMIFSKKIISILHI